MPSSSRTPRPDEPPANTRQIAERFDAFARRYALLDRLEPVTGLRWLRRRLLAGASGQVLVVAAGTGMDLPHLGAATRVVATDASAGMLAVAATRGRVAGPPVSCAVTDAQALALRDRTFDTVVATLSLCTIPDPVAALREMGRVCRTGGQILLLDHGRSDRAWLARYQDRRDWAHARSLGCHVNREPDHLVVRAGLRVTAVRRLLFGTCYLIHATPE